MSVIFLHGGGQTRQSWGGALTEAARRSYRVVTINLRGHGESGWFLVKYVPAKDPG